MSPPTFARNLALALACLGAPATPALAQEPVAAPTLEARAVLPADAFANNATFVGESFDLKGLVDDMLQLDPQTNHVVVILGATPLERYWVPAWQIRRYLRAAWTIRRPSLTL